MKTREAQQRGGGGHGGFEIRLRLRIMRFEPLWEGVMVWKLACGFLRPQPFPSLIGLRDGVPPNQDKSRRAHHPLCFSECNSKTIARCVCCAPPRMTYLVGRAPFSFVVPAPFPLSSSIIKIVLAFSGAIRFPAWGTIKFALPPQQLMREGEGPSILIRDFALSLSQI